MTVLYTCPYIIHFARYLSICACYAFAFIYIYMCILYTYIYMCIWIMCDALINDFLFLNCQIDKMLDLCCLLMLLCLSVSLPPFILPHFLSSFVLMLASPPHSESTDCIFFQIIISRFLTDMINICLFVSEALQLLVNWCLVHGPNSILTDWVVEYCGSW